MDKSFYESVLIVAVCLMFVVAFNANYEREFQEKIDQQQEQIDELQNAVRNARIIEVGEGLCTYRTTGFGLVVNTEGYVIALEPSDLITVHQFVQDCNILDLTD